MTLDGAPNHRCGTPMELGVVNRRVVFRCVRCFPKFPERTKPVLQCPVCGKDLSMQPWPRLDVDCRNCGRWFQICPMDVPEDEPGMTPVYGELAEEDVMHYEDLKRPRYVPWGRKTNG